MSERPALGPGAVRLAKSLIPRGARRELGDFVRRTASDQFERERLLLRAEFDAAMAPLLGRLADVEAALEQLRTILRREASCPPPPPKHMQIRVVGAFVPDFVESGFSICEDLNGVLRVAGRELKDFRRILDWGCGCGRTTRALRAVAPAAELHGTDIDPEAIGWLTQNYSRFAEFRLAPHRPPLPYEGAAFDFVVGVSVFTHLPEDMQFQWLEELRRITRPGGFVLVTTSGEQNYRLTPPAVQETMASKGFFFSDGTYGQSISLPAFYQNTFHSVDYIRREWAKYFDIVDIQPGRLQNHQDTVLMRRAG